MAQIQFYHLTTTPLERALPKLLEKALAGGFKTLLVDESEARLEHLNQILWTHDPNSFIPHGGIKDGHAELQPVLLSTQLEAPNGAKLLLVTSGITPPQPENFERVIDIFDGNDGESIAKARIRWKNYKDAGHSISYLKQTESGGWEKRD